MTQKILRQYGFVSCSCKFKWVVGGTGTRTLYEWPGAAKVEILGHHLEFGLRLVKQVKNNFILLIFFYKLLTFNTK